MCYVNYVKFIFNIKCSNNSHLIPFLSVLEFPKAYLNYFSKKTAKQEYSSLKLNHLYGGRITKVPRSTTFAVNLDGKLVIENRARQPHANRSQISVTCTHTRNFRFQKHRA